MCTQVQAVMRGDLSVFFYVGGVYSTDSSWMIGNFPGVLNSTSYFSNTTDSYVITLNSPISVGGKISMKLTSMGNTNFLVKVELMWVQNPGSSP
jgi:hypothetical protein